LYNLWALGVSVMQLSSKAVTGAALLRKMLEKTGAQFYKKVRAEKTFLSALKAGRYQCWQVKKSR